MVRILGLVLIIAAVLSFDGGVAHSADVPGGSDGGLQTLHLSPRLLSSDGAPVSFHDSRVAPQTRRVYEFRYRPGTFGVGGDPEFSTLQAVLLGSKGFQVDVAAWMSRVEGRLAPMRRSVANRGFTVSPADTRLGQIFPRVIRPSMSRINMPARLGRDDFFVNQDGTETLLAVFDRACHIQGVWDFGEGRMHADVQVPGPGLYPLMIVKGQGGDFHMTLGPASLPPLDVVTVLKIEGSGGEAHPQSASIVPAATR